MACEIGYSAEKFGFVRILHTISVTLQQISDSHPQAPGDCIGQPPLFTILEVEMASTRDHPARTCSTRRRTDTWCEGRRSSSSRTWHSWDRVRHSRPHAQVEPPAPADPLADVGTGLPVQSMLEEVDPLLGQRTDAALEVRVDASVGSLNPQERTEVDGARASPESVGQPVSRPGTRHRRRSAFHRPVRTFVGSNPRGPS
jgi:hypothetical protein